MASLIGARDVVSNWLRGTPSTLASTSRDPVLEFADNGSQAGRPESSSAGIGDLSDRLGAK